MIVLSPQEGELFIDFLFVLPPVKGVSEGELASRIIMTPVHAKKLTIKMLEWLRKYEAKCGKIELDVEFSEPEKS